MSEKRKQYLIIMDFLFQKYEVEYETDMSPERVIEKVQCFLFPNEKDIHLISTRDEEKHQKLQLYRSNFPDYYGLVPVTENIKEEDLDFTKYQFYLFRPAINVYLTLYVVQEDNIENNHNILKINLIFPVNKTVSDLKLYLKDTLLKYANDTNNNLLINSLRNGFKLHIISTMQELNDEFIDQSLNDTEIYLVINEKVDNRASLCSLGRLYYNCVNDLYQSDSNELDSLDIDTDGMTLDEAKEKLIEKHFDDQNIDKDQVNIIFNGNIQTQKFNQLGDLFSDRHFYHFTVIFGPLDEKMNINYCPSLVDDRRSYSIPVPREGRPLIVKIE